MCGEFAADVAGTEPIGAIRWQCAENLSLMKPALSQLLVPSLKSSRSIGVDPAAYAGGGAGLLMVTC